MMQEREIRYCLSKQLSTAHTLQTNYGDVEIDEEMQAAIAEALRGILERRLDPGRPVRPHRSGGGHWEGADYE